MRFTLNTNCSLMKKFILRLSFLFVTSLVFSQSASWGFKVGLNYNSNGDFKNSVSDLIENPDANIGYHVGFYGQLGKRLFLRPELVYTSTKSKYHRMDFRMQKIDVPILVGLKIIGPLYAFAGPTFQYILDSELDDYKHNSIEKDLTLGLNIGVGIRIKRLSLDLRYERGLTENEAQFLDNNDINIGTIDTRPKQLILSLSYAL
jgi:hypothetical protein